MIVVRTEFQIKYGRIKEAIVLWKEIITLLQQMDQSRTMRLYTDITGPAYRLIFEMEEKDAMEYGQSALQWGKNERVRELYRNFVDLCEKSELNLLNIEL